MHGLGFGVPIVECASDSNGVGCRMREFKANGHELGPGALGVVMVMIMFHNCEFKGFLWRNSFTEHFCNHEDDEGSEKASASEEIYQGVTSGGKHGWNY